MMSGNARFRAVLTTEKYTITPKCQVPFAVALNIGLWVALPTGESIQGKTAYDVKQ